MFSIGDKVFDSHIHQIGTVSNIYTDITENYPIQVRFSDFTCSYSSKGNYYIQTDSRHIKKIKDITGIIKVGPTHIYIPFSHSSILLPIALTSFNIVNDIIIATYNGKEYTVHIDNIDQVIEQLLNPNKKELLWIENKQKTQNQG